ncbi:Rhomboid protease GlpG [Streptomyces sp. RB5]|uniref:Rhomboid protease GlpG n=1 Tax=Streptomyces smaragdinus TaxID=2585196 RepID=A0A7K0CTP0_9ACTN|nr:rhomboid family intramembrane serine protease [Streptomyces smaragdinus]MQY16372.1 Rhomboid protease GlpG [Streptomyces smaragdinus]
MEASSTPTPEDGRAAPPECYRHPGRETHVRCTRCERYICPDCMREAAVGFQCPECVNEGNKGVRHARTVFGATIRRDFTPVVTYALIGLTVLGYVLEIIGGDDFVRRFYEWGGVVETTGGGTYTFPDTAVSGGEWYRLITYAFLHQQPTHGAGVLHILMNMYLVWQLGPVIEEGLGRVRYLALYLLSAFGGGVLAYVISPESAVVGASGAVFGLMACYFLMTRRNGRPDTPILMACLIWLVISANYTSWEGHLGGLLAGGAVAYAYAYAPQKHRAVLHVAACAGVFVVLAALTAVKTAALT